MLAPGQDFVVETKHGILRCQPKTPEATAAFKVLQIAVARLLPQIPDAPKVDITVDGVIGPSLTLAVQVLAQRLADGGHTDLAGLAGAQPEEAIPAIAAGSMEITGYIERVLDGNPNAILAPQTSLAAPVDPIAMLRSIFTGKRIIAAGAALLGLGAVILVGASAHRRALGLVDRSGMLPSSDGSDDFDEGDEAGDHGDDDEHDDDGIDRAGAIDVASHEVPAHAA